MMGMLLIQYLQVIIFEKVVLNHRHDLRCDSILVLPLYPFYNVLLLVFRFIGLVFNIMFYTPWTAVNTTIRKRIARNTLPPPLQKKMIQSSEEFWYSIWGEKGDNNSNSSHTDDSKKRDNNSNSSNTDDSKKKG